jgi:hypothetical protein
VGSAGVHPDLAQTLVFEEAPGSGGLPVIDARLLKAGVTYIVEFKDARMEVMDSLSDEEQAAILAVRRSHAGTYGGGL